ncbi:MAG: hypothetical protein E6J90_18015 [Deltaproteobacteria bacterium]|nr:MAG: hypothetical protein E6J90_18015 [Deltaproteobacteria bacterium]
MRQRRHRRRRVDRPPGPRGRSGELRARRRRRGHRRRPARRRVHPGARPPARRGVSPADRVPRDAPRRPRGLRRHRPRGGQPRHLPPDPRGAAAARGRRRSRGRAGRPAARAARGSPGVGRRAPADRGPAGVRDRRRRGARTVVVSHPPDRVAPRACAARRRRQAALLLPEPDRAHPAGGGVSTRRDTVGIAGAGPFGTALGSVLARAGRRVVLWSRDAAVVDAIRSARKSPRLPSAPLPEPLEATADPRRLASEARFVVLAVTSTNVRDRARELGDVLDGSHIVVHAIGALAAPGNDRVSQVMEQGLPTLKIGAIAGPALPDDLAEGKYSSIVIASAFDEVVGEGRRLLNTPPALRVYGSRDVVGVELASALSGAYTVVLGLSDGLDVGPGTRAVLITRALAEASRLGVAAGAEARTFSGLAGLGNLLVRGGDRPMPNRSAD